ncbi:MAG: hypothetical protein GEU81_04580 [Nitriliruptorales bacterium]|nr:hypothetical protein [Nitriliruptorales bacterium]
MAERDLSRRGGWSFRPGLPVTEPLDVVMQLPVPAGDRPAELHLVFTGDGLYVPAVIRKPVGNGPFPAVLCMHGGSGGMGVTWLADFMLNRGFVFERLLAEGYLVCWTEGRMEIEEAYGTDIEAALDHQDLINTFRYVQRLPYVDAERVALFGVSHGGELQMKLISELGGGPAALVPVEPAVIEYLGLRYEGPRTEANLRFNSGLTDDQIDLERATERIERISPSVPILVMGRDDDHLQGLFGKLHELLERAGKRAEWASWDHPEHAYQWGPLRTRKAVAYQGAVAEIDESYEVDGLQQDTLETLVAFLNRHVQRR